VVCVVEADRLAAGLSAAIGAGSGGGTRPAAKTPAWEDSVDRWLALEPVMNFIPVE
jgi:hypothetical protein